LINQNLRELADTFINLGDIYAEVAMTGSDKFFSQAIQAYEQAILSINKTSTVLKGSSNHILVYSYSAMGLCSNFLKKPHLAEQYWQQALQLPLLNDKQQEYAKGSQDSARRWLLELQQKNKK
jgi:hypothetical protein